MHIKSQRYAPLSASAAIILISLFLVSLPVLASAPDRNRPVTLGLSTASISATPEFFDSAIPYTVTVTITSTMVITSTQTPTPTITSTPTPFPTQNAYLPYLYKDHFNPTKTPTPTPPPPEKVLFCDDISQPLAIPDNNANGINNDISISDSRILVNLRLYLDIKHSWVGDLVVNLSNLTTSQTLSAIHRPGPDPYGCSNNNIVTILDSGATRSADDVCASYPNAISGIYLPNGNLNDFTGQSISGVWRLNVSDRYVNDTGTLNHWCLEAQLAEEMPAPTPSPTPVDLPPSAYISGMSGQNQQLNLDCESRSAVDWAKHFGVNIDEFDFLNHLVSSDDPETGFVGNPDGIWGYIPPNDYGVHAVPVAAVLRDYGLTATAVKSLKWDELRAEIAAGNPVEVWIIGDYAGNLVNGTPHYYMANSTGNLSIVAPYEHTVIVTGYDGSNVKVLNGARFMDIPITQFLDSWSALDFMAVLARP